MEYAISDLHGCFDLLKNALNQINFSESDTMYILGDVLDRGEEPIELLLYIIDNPLSFKMINGNHELDFLKNYNYIFSEETLIDDVLKYDNYLSNGGAITLEQFKKCDDKTQEKIVSFIEKQGLYFEIPKRSIVMAHGGISKFSEDKKMDDYSERELTMHRYKNGEHFFKDKILVCGHTPTLKSDRSPAEIFVAKNNGFGDFYNIDCGCAYPDCGGRLAVLRLEDMEKIYVDKGK